MLSKVASYTKQAEAGVSKAQELYNQNKPLIQHTYKNLQSTAEQLKQIKNQVKTSGIIGNDEANFQILRSGKKISRN